MRSVQELRGSTGQLGRSARRSVPRLHTCHSWGPQRTQPPNSDASSGPPSGGFAPPAVSDKTISAEEDFLRRTRKMQRRIAKLKLLQEKISQLREDKDFLQAYKEVEASASDYDSDSEDDPVPPPGLPDPRVGGAQPGPSASAEELRSWVAGLVAQSAARAAGSLGQPGPARGAPTTTTNNNTNNNTSGSSSSSSSSSSSPDGGYTGGQIRSVSQEARGQQPASWSGPAVSPPQQQPAPPPRLASSAAALSPSSSRASTNSPGLHPAAAAVAAAASKQQQQPQPAAASVRRYSVRYSASSSQPIFVPAGGATTGHPPASQNTATTPSPPPPAQQQQVRPAGRSAAVRTPPSTSGSWRSAAQPPAPGQQPQQQWQSPVRQSAGSIAPPPSRAGALAAAAIAAAAGQAAPAGSKNPQPLPSGVTSATPPPAYPAAAAGPPGPMRDPNAELRATAFPESLTSTNPYTLYDMPLTPLPLPKSWLTAAERKVAAEAAAAGTGAAAPAAPQAPVGLADRPRDLVFVTAEAAPWSKTGGLGDVMGALPRSLAARGHRVMVVSPRYLVASTEERYKGLTDTGVRARLDLGAVHSGGGGLHEVGFFHQHSDGVDWVFVDHMSYHREGTPYGNADGTYGDNLFRFSLLCLAACEAPLLLHVGGYRHGAGPGLPYGQNVTFVANDWHAGLVPVYLAAKYRRHGVFKGARCVLALHNLAHQGAHPPPCFDSLGLPGEWYGALEWVHTGSREGPGEAVFGQRTPTINILKAALVTADRLVTVSPAYAWEICAEGGQQGVGLTSLLRQRAKELAGIVNGIDTAEWDPRTDPYIPRNYHEASLGGKGLCKAALQEAMGLPADPAAPLVGFIGRLDYQKGPDLVLGALGRLVAAGCQVVLLGSGAADYEAAFRAAAAAYPANVRAHVGFSVPLSHRILAASDILLMPSRFEPCGLNQLYAMRYGTVPVAHGTGGLRDTIDDVNPFTGEGGRSRQDEAEDLDELFAKSLAWGRPTGPRSADDPAANNAAYYEPFQDYFGSAGRYGAVEEEDEQLDEQDAADAAMPSWRRGLGRSRDPGTGWTFAPASEEALLDAVTSALNVYERHPDKWRRIQLAGMRRDFSWGRAARHWEAVFDGVNAAAAYCK